MYVFYFNIFIYIIFIHDVFIYLFAFSSFSYLNKFCITQRRAEGLVYADISLAAVSHQ